MKDLGRVFVSEGAWADPLWTNRQLAGIFDYCTPQVNTRFAASA